MDAEEVLPLRWIPMGTVPVRGEGEEGKVPAGGGTSQRGAFFIP